MEEEMTREQMIDELVEMAVAKWGEGERDAARDMHARKSDDALMQSLGSALILRGAPGDEERGEALHRACRVGKMTARERKAHYGAG